MKNTYFVMGAAQSDVKKALDEKGVNYETFSKDNDPKYPYGHITFKTDLTKEEFRKFMPEGYRGDFVFISKTDYNNINKTSPLMIKASTCFYMIEE